MKKVLIVIFFILLGTSLIFITNSNKGVENSFEIEYHNNKNLALPDLTGKTEISTGVYRLYNGNGITIDYNVRNGFYVLNGTATSGFNYTVKTGYQPETYTLSFHYSNGTINAYSLGLVVAMAPPHISDNYVYVYANNLNPNPRSYAHTDNFILMLFIQNNVTYNNFTFKLQLEKGTTATSYIVPKLVPIYIDNLTIEEKQKIGFVTFGGFSEILKSISQVISPLGNFVNGILSLF